MLGRNHDRLHGGPTIFMKSVATTVVLAFLMLILTPTVVAARDQDGRSQRWIEPAPSSETRMALAVDDVRALLERLDGRLVRARETGAERRELRRLRGEIADLDRAVLEDFAEVEQRLLRRGLPEVILQRYRVMVAHYQTEVQSRLSDFDGIDQETDQQRRGERAKATQRKLRAKPFQRSQQLFDPDDLPNRSLRPDRHNKPKRSKNDFAESGLFDTPFERLAAVGEFRFDQLAGADDPAYLSESVEVVLTQPSRDKAAELGHDPVRIYHWVRNHIQWQPT